MAGSLDTWKDLGVVVISSTAPKVPENDDGRVWWNPSTSSLSIWINGAWNPVGSGTPISVLKEHLGAYVFVSENQPNIIDKFEGDLWYKPSADQLSIRINGVFIPISLVGATPTVSPTSGTAQTSSRTQVINLSVPGGATIGTALNNWMKSTTGGKPNLLTGSIVFASYGGNVYVLKAGSPPGTSNSWYNVTTGSILPAATRAGELMVSGPGPAFAWQAGGIGDLGRY